MTKILFVSGDDYAALAFEEKYKGQLVSDILPKLDTEDGEEIPQDDEYSAQITYEIKEFEVIADEALLQYTQALKDESDYDMLKHSNYYPENAIIGKRYHKEIKPKQ